MDTKVDAFIEKHEHFSTALSELKGIILSTGLVETIKWGMPTYTLNGKNIVGLGAFKAHYGIWFFQGGLLEDVHKVLMNAQEGKTQAMRQWRFTSESTLDAQLIRAYILEAIENERKGLKITPNRKKKPLVIPPELTGLLNENPALTEAFNGLSLTKKREFAEYIIEAKRPETKVKRLEKIVPMMLSNTGLNDKYKNC